MDQNRDLEGSWGVLEPSWRAQEPKKHRKMISWAPSWDLSWSPKSIKIGPKSDSKCDHFLDGFGESFLKRFGANLGPS